MRIVLDLQGCQSVSRFRGIGRYSMALAKAIVRQSGEHDVRIVLNDLFPGTVDTIRRSFEGLLPPDCITVFSLPLITRFQNARDWRNRAAALIREQAIDQLRPDIVHISSLFEGYTDFSVSSVDLLNRGTLTAVTLYDLIPYLNPKRYLADPGFAEHYFGKIEALKRADVLLAISEFCGEEAVRELEIPRATIVNISSAVSDDFLPSTMSDEQLHAVHQRYGLTRPFVMTTGIVEPRKNLEGLIDAFSRMPAALRSRYQLFIVCQANEDSRSRLFALARSHGLAPDDLVLSGYVPDDDLTALYGSCALFVFPSLHEGFGLPALEAMACGAPVIGSSTTSIPEVIGRDDALFNPLDYQQMAGMIERALTDADYRRMLIGNAAARVPLFSWDETGKRALKAFEDAYASRASSSRSAMPTVGDTSYRALIRALAELPGTAADADFVAAADAIALNQHVDRLPRLLIDVSVLCEHDARSGIQRVTRAIVRQLLSSPPAGYEVRPVRLDRSVMVYRYANRFIGTLDLPHQPASPDDEWLDTQQGDIFVGLDLVADCVPDAAEWYAAQRRRGVKVYFVVYDLLPIHRPDWFPKSIATAFPPWLAAITLVADGIVAISQAVAEDFANTVERDGGPEGRPFQIGYFHLGADLDAAQPSMGMPALADSVRDAWRQRSTFLMVGTIEPRKGHEQALAAFDRLWSSGKDANLLIIGKAGWGTDGLTNTLKSHRESGKRLFWIDDASDEFLALAYRESSALLVPSLGEGFGLPLIEAAKAGLPLLIRDIPVFREVAGTRAFYFSGNNPEDLERALTAWMGLDSTGNAPQSAGMERLTWNDSARQLADVVLGNRWFDTLRVAPDRGR